MTAKPGVLLYAHYKSHMEYNFGPSDVPSVILFIANSS